LPGTTIAERLLQTDIPCLRVSVVGTSCSGKTTLARRISQACGIPHTELDAIHWGPNWTELSVEDFRRAVAQVTAGEAWVIDGNYHVVRDIVWGRATHVVWLNLPFARVFWQALTRTAKRVAMQEELWAGNRETPRQVIFDRESILWWVLRTYRRRRREYPQLFQDPRYTHLKVYELCNNAQTQAMLDELGQGRLP
jgi:adenylate kinase family enzyme